MSRSIRVAAAVEVPVGGGLELVVEERLIALFHTAEGWFALDGVCPHQGGPLGKGRVEGCRVVCPWHGWQFDLSSGRHYLRDSLVQPHWPVRVDENQDVWIEFPAGLGE